MSMRQADWNQTATATNAAATATQAAPPASIFNYVTALSASLSGAGTALLTLKNGTTVIGNWYVSNTAPVHISFTAPIKMSAATLAEASLAAGGAGIVGAVTMSGYAM